MNPAHFHLMLNHLPVVGLPFALVLAGWGAIRRNPSVMKAGFVALIAVALIAISP